MSWAANIASFASVGTFVRHRLQSFLARPHEGHGGDLIYFRGIRLLESTLVRTWKVG